MLKSRLLGTVVALVVSSGVAAAADLGYKVVPTPVPVAIAAYTWSGVYVGVHAGYGWAQDFWKGFPGGPNGEGAVVGGHAGVNWQSGAAVLGIEGSWDWNGLSSSKSCIPGLINCTTDHNWTGDIRGRLGYASNRFLVYGAAGVAMTDVDAKVSVPLFNFSRTANNTHVGWTAGIGAEYAFTNNVILGVEWKYTDFGSETYKFGGLGSAKIDIDTNVIQARASYKF